MQARFARNPELSPNSPQKIHGEENIITGHLHKGFTAKALAPEAGRANLIERSQVWEREITQYCPLPAPTTVEVRAQTIRKRFARHVDRLTEAMNLALRVSLPDASETNIVRAVL